MSYSLARIKLLTVHTVFTIRDGIVGRPIFCTTDAERALKEINQLARQFYGEGYNEIVSLNDAIILIDGLADGSVIYRSTQLAIEEEPSAFGFGINDVLTLAEEEGTELTEDQAKDILHLMNSKADVSAGISWDTISYFTNLYLHE